MAHSSRFATPSRKLKRQTLRWITQTKDFVKQLETSGLVVNHGHSEEVPADVRERSSAIAGACIELTHGMLVIAGVIVGLDPPRPLVARDVPEADTWVLEDLEDPDVR